MTHGRESRPAGPASRMTKPPRQCGVTLVETMVASVVVITGLLGTSVLQLRAMQSTDDAIQRSNAAYLALDIIERMRANRPALAAYVGTVEAGAGASGIDCLIGDCTPAELAAFDRDQWRRALHGEDPAPGPLASPTGCIKGPGEDGVYTVSIAWRGRVAVADPAADSCGRGSGRYDDGQGNPDVQRRVLTLSVYLAG